MLIRGSADSVIKTLDHDSSMQTVKWYIVRSSAIDILASGINSKVKGPLRDLLFFLSKHNS